MAIEDASEVAGEVSPVVMFFTVVDGFGDFFCGGVLGEPIGIEVEEVGELFVESSDALVVCGEEAEPFFGGIKNELREFGGCCVV